MKNKKTVWYVVLVVVIAVLAFYGGMSYGKSATSSTTTQRQSGFAQGGNASGNFVRQSGVAGAGMNAGTIIAKDSQSITIKLASGGSKIIFYTSSTSVSKTTAGTPADLVVGENVNVLGATNSDGSVNAQSVQIRPAIPQTSSASSATSITSPGQ
jgi:hypothetical protein